MPDLGDFDLMHPCGLKGVRMTSMAERLGDRTPELAEVRERFAALLAGRLGYDEIVWAALPKTMMPEAASVASRRERIGEART
jgi:lipoate-protein ligase B